MPKSEFHVAHIPEAEPQRAVALQKWRRERRRQLRVYLMLKIAERGWTITHMAQTCEINLSYLSRIINGYRTPSLETTMRIARAFGVPLEELANMVVGHNGSEIEDNAGAKR